MKTHAVRIGIVSGGLKLGGSTTFLLNLGSELARLNCEVMIWSMEPNSPLAKDFEQRNLTVRWIGQHAAIYEDRIRGCLRELAGFQPSMLIANLGPEAFEVLRYVTGSLTKVGIIHSDDPGVYRSLGPYFRLADYVVGVSPEICRRLREQPTIVPEQIRLIGYGIELRELAHRSQRDPVSLRVLYLGRLDQTQKRVRLLAPIAMRLRELETSFHLTIVGEGPERPWLAEMIRRNDLSPWVELRPAVPYCEVPGLFNRFDVMLLPSAFEGLPLTLLESMAAGVVPVVTRLRSGSEDLIHSSNGILVEPENTDGYADAINLLARNRDLLDRLSEGARRTITDHYSSRTMAEQWLALNGDDVTATFEVSKVLPPYGSEKSLRFTAVGRLLRRTKALALR